MRREGEIPHATILAGSTGRSLFEHEPIISKEQAAADKAWTIQAIKDGRLRAMTLPEQRAAKKKSTDARVDEAQRLYTEENLSLGECALAVGMKRTTLNYQLRKRGVKFRNKSEAKQFADERRLKAA